MTDDYSYLNKLNNGRSVILQGYSKSVFRSPVLNIRMII